MKKQAVLKGSISLLMGMGILAALAWGLRSAYSVLAQDITDINPLAYAGPDQAVEVGDTVALDGSGSYDPDNDLPLSFLWAQTGGPAVAFNPVLSVTSFTAPAAPVVLTFTLAVTDSLGFADPTPDEVVVRALGQPTANDDSGAGFTTDEDTPFVTADVLANDTDSTDSPLSLQSFDTSETLGQLSLAAPAGGLDTTGFNTPDGFVTVNFGGSSNYVYGIATQPDGKSIVAGATYMSGHFLFAMARYNPNGSLDTTFGSGGIVTTIFNDSSFSWAIAVQPDGKILLAGKTRLDYDENFALARYNPDGSLDVTFGSGGKATADFGSEYDEARDIAIQPDGKIVLAGSTDQEDFAIARFNPDGSLDSGFGDEGMVVTNFGMYENTNDMALQADGKFGVVGNYLLVRYLGGTYNTGYFTYDPNGQFDDLGSGETATDTFTYVVSDGVLTNTATVSITVTGIGAGVNDPPLFTSTPVTTTVATMAYTYTITADDPDIADILTFTAPTLPAWLTLIDHGDRTATLSGTPPTPGSFPVVLEVSDGITSTAQAFTITVTPIPENPVADLSISQAFQWTSSSSGVLTLVVSNLGPDAAPGAVVSDTFPLSFSNVTWTCAGSGGAACSPSGSGNIDDTLSSFPAGGVVTYTVTVGDILLGSWSNTAQVLAPAGVSDPDLADNQATFGITQVLLPVALKP